MNRSPDKTRQRVFWTFGTVAVLVGLALLGGIALTISARTMADVLMDIGVPGLLVAGLAGFALTFSGGLLLICALNPGRKP